MATTEQGPRGMEVCAQLLGQFWLPREEVVVGEVVKEKSLAWALCVLTGWG